MSKEEKQKKKEKKEKKSKAIKNTCLSLLFFLFAQSSHANNLTKEEIEALSGDYNTYLATGDAKPTNEALVMPPVNNEYNFFVKTAPLMPNIVNIDGCVSLVDFQLILNSYVFNQIKPKLIKTQHQIKNKDGSKCFVYKIEQGYYRYRLPDGKYENTANKDDIHILYIVPYSKILKITTNPDEAFANYYSFSNAYFTKKQFFIEDVCPIDMQDKYRNAGNVQETIIKKNRNQYLKAKQEKNIDFDKLQKLEKRYEEITNYRITEDW